MTFHKHKEQILNFYDKTNSALDEHKQTFGDLLSQLNKKSGITQTLNTNLDDFMEHSFTDFNAFRTELESNPLEDSIIDYVYDINKNDYLDAISLPDKHIVAKQLFSGVLIDHEFKNLLNRSSHPVTYLRGKEDTCSFKDRTYISGDSIESNGTLMKQCNCPTHCNCNNHSIDFLKHIFNNFKY